MCEQTARAWTELSRAALRHNAALLRGLLPAGCELMPALKADAYGHGAAAVAGELAKMGVRAFCVATAREGAALRESGVRGVILVLGYTGEQDLPLLMRHDLTQTVVDLDCARLLADRGEPVRVHIAVDTGMHRLGVGPGELEQLCALLRRAPLRVEGVFTHLCAADGTGLRERAYTRAQAAAFWETVQTLRAAGCAAPKAHLLNSAGLLGYPEFGGDYARVGIALYGTLSTREELSRCGLELRAALSLRARVSSVRLLRRGECAGYGMDFAAPRDTVLASLAIGYADGLPRALSGGVGGVLLHGCRAPIVGRVCMDQTLVDVTDIGGAHAGDTATLIGEDGGQSIHVCDVAAQVGTIANEILSRLGPRLGRVVQ
ncbi:serine racemase VanT catalytic subunit [Feifania hominis]|uniref:Alanine racemase n=1 Tax=Feifania hominis TaxID=2763660 RepID=A0A926HQU3_9FIRM|nr:serine racemase VanT catalytic subunit [Feifania hominis]MBC8536717.1 serine racemase VanT catalytic subunit [Feifania hominis]